MNRKLISAATVAALTLGVMASPGQADVPITVNAGVGYWLFDNESGLEDDTTPWMSIEWAFTDQWAAELLYAKDSFEIEGFRGNADVEHWNLDVLYYTGSYVGNTPRLRPYLALGAGQVNIDGGSFSQTDDTANIGAGVRWMMTSRFGARLEARMVRNFDEHENDALISAGVNYYFGNVTPPPAPVVIAAAPAPEAAPVTQVASYKLTVNFAFDSDRVEERYFTDVSELAAFLKRFDDVMVDVEGHTDSTGPEEYNQGLSERRAQAVVDLLVSEHGIPSSRLNAVGFGESQPVTSNDSRDGRTENRRTMATLEVEFAED